MEQDQRQSKQIESVSCLKKSKKSIDMQLPNPLNNPSNQLRCDCFNWQLNFNCVRFVTPGPVARNVQAEVFQCSNLDQT